MESADASGAVEPVLLIVDDHRANLLALEVVLKPLGITLVTAQSGTEALRKAASQDFALVLMDVHMPGLDGYQTTAMLRQQERTRDVPVIFLTAVHDHPEHMHRGYALGAVDYITKPFDPLVLRAKISALVALHMRAQLAERTRSQEAERLKSLFLATVGHDLRSPLNAILMAAQSILRRQDGCAVAAHRNNAERIERAAKRMNGIIEDVLELTRGELTESIPVTPRPTDLGVVCRNVVEESQMAHPTRRLDLEVRGEVRGMWDPERLERLAANLVGNALVYGGEAPVRVRVVGEGDRVALAVHNGGAPIDARALPTLFEPFRRGSLSGNGLGLGLYIVREIVRAHHGSVDVSSTTADGTTFTVVLPRNAAGGEQANVR